MVASGLIKPKDASFSRAVSADINAPPAARQAIVYSSVFFLIEYTWDFQ